MQLFVIISSRILLRMRNVLDKSCRENQKTRFVFSNSPPPENNRAVREIMWKNITEADRPPFMRWCGKIFVESDRPQMTIRRMCVRCWITKATDKHSEYVMLIAFSAATVVTRTYLTVAFIRTLPDDEHMCSKHVEAWNKLIVKQ